MPRSAGRGGKKTEAPAPRIGPGSTYDSVPANVIRHMKRYSNKIVINMDTVSLKVRNVNALEMRINCVRIFINAMP